MSRVREGHWYRADRPAVEGMIHSQIQPNENVGPVTGQLALPPNSCNPSLTISGPCSISIAHRVRVQCKTACCVTDPYNDTSICVHGGPPTAAVLQTQATVLGTLYEEYATDASSMGQGKEEVWVPCLQLCKPCLQSFWRQQS